MCTAVCVMNSMHLACQLVYGSEVSNIIVRNKNVLPQHLKTIIYNTLIILPLYSVYSNPTFITHFMHVHPVCKHYVFALRPPLNCTCNQSAKRISLLYFLYWNGQN